MRGRYVSLVWSLAGLLLLLPLAAPGAAAGQGDAGVGALPAEASEFDFFVGTWRVGANATDKVKKFGKGLAILETYKVAGGGGGWSVTVFDATTKTWTQTWQTTSGNYTQFTGKKEGDDIVLVGKVRHPQSGAVGLMRLSFVNITRNSFEQKYDLSTDGGKTWSNSSRIPFTRMR